MEIPFLGKTALLALVNKAARMYILSFIIVFPEKKCSDITDLLDFCVMARLSNMTYVLMQ